MKRAFVFLSLFALGCGFEPRLPAVDFHLKGLTLEAPGTSFPVESALQLKAWAHYSDGTRVDVTADTGWTSSQPSVGVIGPTGIVTFNGSGATKFEGSYQGKRVAITLFATAATLTSVTLSSVASGELAKGEAREFAAWATYSDGSRLEVTERALWSVDGNVLTLGDRRGRVLGAQQGTGSVHVNFHGVEGGEFVVVAAPRATQLGLTVSNAIFRPGESQQLAALATFSDGSTRDVSGEATWTSSDAARVGFGAQPGSIVALAVGSSHVTARWNGLQSSALLSVQARRLTALAFSEVALTLAHGLSGRVALMGTFDDGTREDVSELALWSSSAPAVASVIQGTVESGTVLTHDEGGATVTAALDNQVAQLQVSVTAPVLVGLDTTLHSGRLAPGQEASFMVVGRWSDGAVLNLSTEVTLQHGDELATSLRGNWIYARGAELGAAQLVFEYAGFRGLVDLEVTPHHVVEFRVTQRSGQPWGSDVAGLRLVAYARYADGIELEVTELSSWYLADASVARVSDEPGSRGRLTLTTGGTTELNAALNQWLVTRTMNFAPAQ